MPSSLTFSPVQMEDKELFAEIRQNCDLYSKSSASETSFESIYCWSAGENAQRCIIDEGIIILYQFTDGSMAFYPPIVKKREYFLPVVRMISEYCWMNNLPVYIERLTKEMANIAEELDCKKCRTIVCRGDFEYLYNPTEFIELNGKKYKGKRNHLSGFKAIYDYELLSYMPDMKNEVLELVIYCGKDPASIDFDMEYRAIERALDSIDVLNLYCDVIKVEEKIIALSIGFISEANVGVCMFEKANIEYRGSYAAINNLVAEKHFKNCEYINRQEDMSIEGLRISKLSYHPVAFSEKYIITDRADTLQAELEYDESLINIKPEDLI